MSLMNCTLFYLVFKGIIHFKSSVKCSAFLQETVQTFKQKPLTLFSSTKYNKAHFNIK